VNGECEKARALVSPYEGFLILDLPGHDSEKLFYEAGKMG
jgi:hypothetical protein